MEKKAKLKKLRMGILRLLFPPKCALCGRLVREEDQLLCPACKEHLPHAPAGKMLWVGKACLQCAAPFYYEGSLRQAFLRYKFQGKDFYGELFGAFTAKAAAEQLPGGWELVTWAPLSKKRLKQRGYDQARLLAEVTAEELGLPLERTLVKVKHTKPQSGINDGEARAKNAKGAYAPVPGLCLEGKRVLLVDDILTTGSTLKECAKILLRCGAAQVDCAVLARHRPKENGAPESD